MKRLYSLIVPPETESRSGTRLQSQLSKQGVLAGGSPQAERISLAPNELLFEGAIADETYGDLLAAEFEELFSAPDLAEVVYYEHGADRPADGYYELENPTIEPLRPQVESVQRFEGRLARVGTRGSHWRAVETGADAVDNPFGSEAGLPVGIDARARKARWWDSIDGSLADATVRDTREGDGGVRIAEYDASEPSFSNDPTLVYDLPYEHDAASDCRVWDTWGRDRQVVENEGATVGSASVGSASVGASTVVRNTWQTVFRTDHDVRGEIVVENGLYRLRFDEKGQRLYASEYNAADEHWELVQLGPASPWRLFDLDLTRIAPGRVEAQVEFEDSSSPGTTHNLNMALRRGIPGILWSNPDNEGAVPSGLVDRLEPTAESLDKDPGENTTLAERSEVNR